MTEWLPTWDVLCMYIGCGCVGGMVFLLLGYQLAYAPLDRHAARLEREAADAKRHADQLAAVAGEQMRIRQWGPLTQRTPTMRG
jgi:hypothetical protein